MCSLIGVNERERSKMGIDFEEPQKIHREKRERERERERERIGGRNTCRQCV